MQSYMNIYVQVSYSSSIVYILQANTRVENTAHKFSVCRLHCILYSTHRRRVISSLATLVQFLHGAQFTTVCHCYQVNARAQFYTVCHCYQVNARDLYPHHKFLRSYEVHTNHTHHANRSQTILVSPTLCLGKTPCFVQTSISRAAYRWLSQLAYSIQPTVIYMIDVLSLHNQHPTRRFVQSICYPFYSHSTSCNFFQGELFRVTSIVHSKYNP